jgi:invasion protein IalB
VSVPNFFAAGRCFEAYADTSEIKQFNYGDWTLNCEKLGNNRLSECSLVQNVKDPSASDGLAWIQSSLDVRNSGELILTLRFDRSIMTESGAILRIDEQPVGVSSFFECDTEFCKSATVLAKGENVTDFGTLFQLGKTLSVDFKTSLNSGYRLPLNLNKVKEGISALYAVTREPTLPTDKLVQAPIPPANGLIGPYGFVFADDSQFKIEVVQFKFDNYKIGAADDKSVADDRGGVGSGPLGADYRYGQLFHPSKECSASGSSGGNSDLGTMVVVGSDLTVASGDEKKLRDLVKRAGQCQGPQAYVIAYDPGTREKAHEDSASSWSFRFKQGLSIKRAMTEVGVPSNRVFLGDRGTINLVADFTVPTA